MCRRVTSPGSSAITGPGSRRRERACYGPRAMLVRSALVWLLGAAGPAEPVGPTAGLVQWQAPPSCPDRDALQAAIDRRLGHPLAGADVAAQVRRDGREYVLGLRLTVAARSETRELRDTSCTALVEAIAVRVAAALEPAPDTAVP